MIIFCSGYMSGEAYELPETRQELQEPTLASIEEVSSFFFFAALILFKFVLVNGFQTY